MESPVRILVHGASGRMGRALLALAADDPRLCVVAAASARGLALAEFPALPVLATSDLSRAPEFDVAVDFSLAGGFDAILDLCLARGAAFVSGTTGLDEAQRARLVAAARTIAVLNATNFSLGVAVLERLVQQAAAALPDWDCDLVEAHHVHKRDAPSGAALTLGAAVARGRGAEPRYASLRAGDIVGEHTVMLSGPGERLEFVHRATDRAIFARGALECAWRMR